MAGIKYKKPYQVFIKDSEGRIFLSTEDADFYGREFKSGDLVQVFWNTLFIRSVIFSEYVTEKEFYAQYEKNIQPFVKEDFKYYITQKKDKLINLDY